MENEQYYRLWHRCLELNRGAWEGRVEDAFRAADGLLFEQWWERCRDQFEYDHEPYLLDVLETKEDFAWWHDKWQMPEEGDSVVVLVNLLNSKADLEAAFRELLQKVHKQGRGKPKRDDATPAEFNLKGELSKPHAAALKKALDVWEAIKKDPSKPLTDVATDLKINETRSVAPKGALGAKPEPAAQGAAKAALNAASQKQLRQQVQRMYDRAQVLIDGVGRGVFPAS